MPGCILMVDSISTVADRSSLASFDRDAFNTGDLDVKAAATEVALPTIEPVLERMDDCCCLPSIGTSAAAFSESCTASSSPLPLEAAAIRRETARDSGPGGSLFDSALANTGPDGLASCAARRSAEDTSTRASRSSSRRCRSGSSHAGSRERARMCHSAIMRDMLRLQTRREDGRWDNLIVITG